MSKLKKVVLYKDEARVKLMQGVSEIADAVQVTLGPKGRNVILQREYGTHHVTKDGVTVAKEFSSNDPIVNMGSQLIRDVAIKTNDESGDGTTTSVVLAKAILEEGSRLIAMGADPIKLQLGLKQALRDVIDYVKSKVSVSVDDDFETIKRIATVSANGDTLIGELITDAMKKVTTSGVIVVDTAKSMDTSIEVIEGMRLDRGYVSPYFITDVETSKCIYEDPLILVTDHKLSSSNDLVPIFEYINQHNRSLLIIADSVEGELLQTMIINKMKGVLKVTAIKAPSFGEDRVEVLKDIACVTGATFISRDLNMNLKDIGLSALGECNKVIITRDETTIMNDVEQSEDAIERIKAIDAQLATAKGYQRDKLVERKAKLSGGIAVLYVGAGSEIEQKELKDRIDDALNATKSAIEAGYVPGGGITLFRAIDCLDDSKVKEDWKPGYNLMKFILKAPIKALCSNAGISSDLVMEKLLGSDDIAYGLDLSTGDYCNMVERGIIDPTKTIVTALSNAVSIASTVLSTDCVIATVPDEDEKL